MSEEEFARDERDRSSVSDGADDSDSDGSAQGEAALEFAPCDPAGARGGAAGAAAGGSSAGPVDFRAPLRDLVPALLADDARHRVPGVTGGLYSLRDLEDLPRGPLGCGLPVLCMRLNDVDHMDFVVHHFVGGVTPPEVHQPWSPEVFNRLIVGDEVFAEEFAAGLRFVGRGMEDGRRMPECLRGFDLRRHGLVAAGGYPAAVLAGRPEAAGDVDLFLVGHPDDEARRGAVSALYHHLLANSRSRAGRRELVVHRTRGCVTFSGKGRAGDLPATVQVILRAYSSVSELLHGFDLGAAQVAFDGERVFLTAMGVFAATRGANVLNLAVRRVSYEARLARYLRRGFTLAAPDLDVGALRAAGTFPPLRDYVVDPDDALRGGPDLVLLRHDHRGQLATARRVEAAALGAGPPAPPADGPGAAERLAALLEELGPDEPRPAGPDGDYAGAAGGDYAGGAIPYGHPAAIVLRNARVLGAARWGAGPPDGAAVGGRGGAARDPASLLCAAAFTSDPAFDLLGFAPEPFPPFREFLEAVFVRGGAPRLFPAAEALLLGGQLVERLAALQAAPPDLLRRIWEARRGLAHEALAAAGFGPAAFAPVTDRTALSGDPRYATTPAEWLGPLFAGPAER
jgi:hypothetical protein